MFFTSRISNSETGREVLCCIYGLIIILTPVQDIQDIMLTPVWDYINLGYPHPGGEYQQEVERSAEGGPHLR